MIKVSKLDKTLLEISNYCLDIPAEGRKQPVLKGIDLKIKPGESIAIIGPSGSGKSMLALSIMGLIPGYLDAETTGKIALFLDDSRKSNPTIQGQPGWNTMWRRSTGMIFQDPATCFNPLMTCGKQIDEVLICRKNLKKTAAKSATLAFMQETGLDNPGALYHAFPHQLSGGQLQRMSIAMALIGQPELLVADEPASNLDKENKRELIRLIRQLREQSQIALIYITHDIEEAKEISERILVMQEGKLCDNKDLMANPGLISGINPETHSSQQEYGTKFNHLTDKPLIEVSALTKQFVRKNFWGRPFNRVKVLDNVHFRIRRNETVGLMGSSGSGKSTLGRLILGLEQPDHGQILVDGQELSELSYSKSKEIRRKIQVVYQNPYNTLNPRMRILSLVREPLEVHHLLKNTEERNEKARQLLMSCGIPENLHRHYTFQLSGGQRQRVAIARAMILDPEFVVLDECVSSLDVETRESILDLLNFFKEHKNVAYLFISHDEKTVRWFSDSVFILQEGRLFTMDQGS